MPEKKVVKSKAKKAKGGAKTKGGKKAKGGKKGKKKGAKKDTKRLTVIAKAFAYGAHNDLFDLERDTKVMSAVTLEETQALMRQIKSSEKINATSEGREAEFWATGPDAIKDLDAITLFAQLDSKKRGKVDLKSFVATCLKAVKVKVVDKGKTPKQIADEARAVQYAELDWTDKESVITTWPPHIREQIALERKKRIPKDVNLDFFALKVPFSSDYLIDDAELRIPVRAKLTLIGEGGCGKSTLFRAMANQEIRDFPTHLQVHHMQEIEVSADAESLIDTVIHAHPFLMALRRNKEELTNRIEGKAGHEVPSAEVAALLGKSLDLVNTKLRENGDMYAEENASKSLRVLGFDNTAQTKSINSLSGGLRMRVALCAAFFIEADILLLDEPTNHLDFPSLLWLENKLRTYRKSFVMVCHDREILNNVSTGTMLITEDKGIKYYDMGFEKYEQVRWKSEAKMAKDIDKFLLRHRNIDFSSPLALEAQTKRAWLKRYQRKMVLREGQFTFPAAQPLAPDNDQKDLEIAQKLVSVIKMTDLRFSYDAETLPFIFDTPISIDITMGTRMGVMGPNGAGKSTFLKLLTGRLFPVDGSVLTNKNATVAYFSQHHSMEMDLTMTPMEFMMCKFPEEKVGQLRGHLAKVGCSDELTQVRLNDHSQGMRSCVLFAKITYRCPNLLIMDEPTNFLDIETVDALINATNKYKGALLLVSHSRLFLKKCAYSYLSIVPGQFNVYPDLDECEKATYSFIADMENGDKVRIGEGNLATSAGSNSMVKTEMKKTEDGVMLF